MSHAPPWVELIKVIRVQIPQGEGVKGDPIRLVDYYFRLEEGTLSLLAIKDPEHDEMVAR